MSTEYSSSNRDFGVSAASRRSVLWGAAMSGKPLDEFSSASEIQAGPEHTAKHELTEWLKSHDAGVFWEEKNKWGYPTFEIEHDSSSVGTPDLLVLLDGFTFVIEFKKGERVGQLYDALPQLRNYWKEYVTNDLTYYAGGVDHVVDGFLTASEHSPNGRLFPRYAETRQDHLDMDETRQGCYDWGQLPPAEYRMTEQHIRILWRDVKDIAGEELATSDKTPHIGSLLSDVLERPNQDPQPAVLWNEGNNNQSWEVLG